MKKNSTATTAKQKVPCVFLDRDGCIIEDAAYLKDPGEARLIPGSAEAIACLNALGVLAVVVTNQSGVARGYFTEETVQAVHQRLHEMLKAHHAHLDAIYYCPFYAQGVVEEYCKDSPLRKPNPGMVDQAADDLPIDLERSYVVGDKLDDVLLGKNRALKTVLVLTGHGSRQLDQIRQQPQAQPDHVARNLAEAIEWVLNDLKAQI